VGSCHKTKKTSADQQKGSWVGNRSIVCQIGSGETVPQITTSSLFADDRQGQQDLHQQ